jgi:hypothetical protein
VIILNSNFHNLYFKFKRIKPEFEKFHHNVKVIEIDYFCLNALFINRHNLLLIPSLIKYITIYL